jgi:hypothetical protein
MSLHDSARSQPNGVCHCFRLVKYSPPLLVFHNRKQCPRGGQSRDMGPSRRTASNGAVRYAVASSPAVRSSGTHSVSRKVTPGHLLFLFPVSFLPRSRRAPTMVYTAPVGLTAKRKPLVHTLGRSSGRQALHLLDRRRQPCGKFLTRNSHRLLNYRRFARSFRTKPYRFSLLWRAACK